MNSEAANFRAWRTSMNSRKSFRISAMGLLLFSNASFAGETRRLTLAEAVRLAVEQNRTLKIARLKVKENEYKKDAARSAYFPTITNESDALHISELQTITTPQGAYGVASGGRKTLKFSQPRLPSRKPEPAWLPQKRHTSPMSPPSPGTGTRTVFPSWSEISERWA